MITINVFFLLLFIFFAVISLLCVAALVAYVTNTETIVTLAITSLLWICLFMLLKTIEIGNSIGG